MDQRARRILVHNVHEKLTEEDIKFAFSQFGSVQNVQMTRDRESHMILGPVTVDFAAEDEAQRASVAMEGHDVGGKKLRIERPQQLPGGVFVPDSLVGNVTAASSAAAQAAQAAAAAAAAAAKASGQSALSIAAAAGAAPTGAGGLASGTRVYVGGIPWNATAATVANAFSVFGPILSCTMMPNLETGVHKGFGFLEFAASESAVAAVKHMGNFTFGDRPIKVGEAMSVNPGLESILPPFRVVNVPAGSPTALLDAAALTAGLAPVSAMPAPVQQPPAVTAAPSAMDRGGDDDDDTNVHIGSAQRRELSAKLAQGAGASSAVVVLRNMVTVADVDAELEMEVSQECSKFGSVVRVLIHQEPPVNVKVFVEFASAAEAAQCCQAMNGRFFAGRQIQAQSYDERQFRSGNYSL